MGIGGQPRKAHGTLEHPYSALNLRLLLAGFGLVSCTVLAVLTWRAGYPMMAVLLGALALLAAIDMVVIQLRRRARKRTDTQKHSLFE